LADQHEIRKGDEESHADIGNMIKMAIFANWRWLITKTANII